MGVGARHYYAASGSGKTETVGSMTVDVYRCLRVGCSACLGIVRMRNGTATHLRRYRTPGSDWGTKIPACTGGKVSQ